MSSIMDGIGDDDQLDENLRKWFKEKWVRFGPDGKIRGPCARGSESEGKPKCLPQKKAQNLGKKGRKYAASKKRREDPNPERSGKAINVATKKKTNEEYCPECGGNMYPETMINEKKDACYYKVKSRYKVWPSAYASGALVKCRKKGASNWGTGGKKNENSIMKGLVDETSEETVHVIYINGKPKAKYAYEREAQQDANRLKDKFPERKIEIRKEVRGGIGGNVKLKDIAEAAYEKDLDDNEPRIVSGVYGPKSKEFRRRFSNQAAQDRFFDHPDREGNYEIHYVQKLDEGVIVGNDMNDPEVAVLGGAGTMSLSRLKKKAYIEAQQLADDIKNGQYSSSSYNMKQLHNTLDTIVAAEAEMKKKYFGEDNSMEFAAEVTPAVNPYDGLEDHKFRGTIGEGIEEAREMSPALRAAQKNLADLASGEVQRKEQERKASIKRQRELDKLAKPQKPTLDQIWQKIEYAISNYFPDGDPTDYLNPYMERNGLTYDDLTRASRKHGYKDLWDYWNTLVSDIEADAYADWLATGGKNVRTRGTFLETPDTSGAVGVQPGGWRTYKPGVAGELDEDTAYAGGMGQGGYAGQSYRKFKPKVAGTFNEEQLDEKCWDTHKQVGMKKKGDKMVPNCVPKESAIMKGIQREGK